MREDLIIPLSTPKTKSDFISDLLNEILPLKSKLPKFLVDDGITEPKIFGNIEFIVLDDDFIFNCSISKDKLLFKFVKFERFPLKVRKSLLELKSNLFIKKSLIVPSMDSSKFQVSRFEIELF